MAVAGAKSSVDPSMLITHRFKGLNSIDQAFDLMVKKPRDLIKPIVFVDIQNSLGVNMSC